MSIKILNPSTDKLLKSFKLDIPYIKAQGLYLYDQQGNSYLDFISQYGAVPFGYNYPEIISAAQDFLSSGLPTMVQPSVPVKAVELADKLIKLAPGEMAQATFCQSGAEAVETAIKLARSTTEKNIILSTNNSFHGKTLGALSATGRPVYQEPFFAPAPGFETIDFNDIEALETKLKNQGSEIAAFIVEPIQGEGGIIIPSDNYLKHAEQICRKYGVLFIIDEVQTGLGRTGSLFASEMAGLSPDIMLLSKALGGGLVPLGVCLSSKHAWNDGFGKLHSSTFANNNFTCSIGLAVIDILTANKQSLVKSAAVMGSHLLEGLKNIDAKFPGVIKDLRGQGLMVGVEFNNFDGSESFSIRYLAQQGGFSALLAGYLLHVHNIRCAPFLNNSMTLRLQPALTVSSKQIVQALKALENVVKILYYQDYSELYSYILDRKSDGTIADFRKYRKPVKSSSLLDGEKPTEKFAFLIHYPAVEDLTKNNPSFSKLEEAELEKLLDWEASLDASPDVIIHLPAFKSKAGKIAEGWLIGVPYSGKHLLDMPRKKAVSALSEAIDLAKDLGAKIVGLGAYTSIVSRGGADLQGKGIAITSGNSFTVATAFDALMKGAAMMNIKLENSVGAVIGATGAIGRVSAIMLAQEAGQLYLVGNPGKEKTSLRRLEKLADEIYGYIFTDLIKNNALLDHQKGIAKWLKGFISHLSSSDSKQVEKLVSIVKKNIDFSFSEFINNNLARTGKFSSPPIKTTVNIRQALLQSDLVITASSSTSCLIMPKNLKQGCVICDVARPADVSRSVLSSRTDVLVIEGGLVKYPDKICFGQNIGYAPGMNLACLSETMLLALEGDYRDFSIGLKLPIEDIYYLKKLARKHGFKLAMPQNTKGVITPEIAETARKNARCIDVRKKA
ncbi:aminotransferase class III-fold pyridoxal phosphate-dependent enzyme [Phosphitispora sp. TUW77]|uniref:aminotransferase class III-fold pyridoxal phosphate-dependent enzyme n=1 Tax=Phosphitispora sp. TUW77 TaxID=3152361 RepID=UPI003AB4B3D5